MHFPEPITITVADEPITILGTDTGSYVASDGRTWQIPAGQEPATDAAGIEAHIALAMAPDLPAIRARLKARATERRWQVETGGIVVGDMPVTTDDRSKTLLMQADRGARLHDLGTRWKGADGIWVPLTAEQVMAAASAMDAHVRACFAREEELHTAIDTAADAPALEALAPDIEAFAL